MSREKKAKGRLLKTKLKEAHATIGKLKRKGVSEATLKGLEQRRCRFSNQLYLLQKPNEAKPFFKKIGGMKFIPLGIRCALYKKRAEHFRCKVNDFTEAQARKLLDTSPTNCPLCKKPFDNSFWMSRKSLDHFIPLSKGGNNAESNIWVMCCSYNTKKRASILKISLHL